MAIDKRFLEQCVVLLSHRGKLDMAATPALRSAVQDCVEAGQTRIVVDLTDTSTLDSSGLGALIWGLKRTRHENGDLRISGANEQVLMVLKMTNLDRMFQPYQTTAEAAEGW